MLHLHGLQRHDRLAGRDLVARFDQHRHDAAIHRRADLAVAAGCRSRYRRGEGQVANRNRDAAMQEMEPVAVPKEFDGFHQAVGAETDRVAAEFVDLETLFPVFKLAT